MLPSWMGREQKAIPVNIGNSYHTAPGWRLCGKAVYTCIEPAAGPCVDPAVLRAIHAFDPGAVPIWQLQAYLPPGKMGYDSVVRVAHVGIARYIRDPKGPSTLPHVEMPEGSRQAPNILDWIWVDMSQTLKDGGPGGVLPFDWGLYQHCLHKFNANSSPVDLASGWLDRTDEKTEREEAALNAEMEYRQRHAEKNIQGILGRTTFKELRDQYMEIRARKRMSERKVMVFQGGR